jgi:glycosyltransferase involved in cell wall biosynthesis
MREGYQRSASVNCKKYVIGSRIALRMAQYNHENTCLHEHFYKQARRHILIVAPSAYPLGGVATWIDYLIPGLRKLGWRVTLGLTAGTFHNVSAYLSVHPIERVIPIRNLTGTREGRVRGLVDAITSARPDIVVSVNIVDVYPAVDRIKRRGNPVRAVMALHGLEPEYYQQMKRSAASLDAVIATNKLACRLASRIGGIESSRIYHAPYGVGIPDCVLTESNGGVAPIRIGFVGRLEMSQKRIDTLVAIVKEMDRQNVGYQLLIAGTGPSENWMRHELKLQVERGVVVFLGVLSNKRVEGLYSQIDALLITSLWETGPIVAWEAMVRGVLVITNAYIGSGLEGNLRHDENCLIYSPDNPASAVERIVEAQNSELRKRVTCAASAFIRQKMTQELSIARWSKCFSQIKNQPSLTPPFKDPPAASAGRLDLLLGRRLGEMVRRVLPRKQALFEPGQEWPHVSVRSQIPENTFWEFAREVDLGEANCWSCSGQGHSSSAGL